MALPSTDNLRSAILTKALALACLGIQTADKAGGSILQGCHLHLHPIHTS